LFSLLAVIGVFCMLIAPLLIVQDEPTVGGCAASVWFVTLGFSLCYGSLFAKLYRLYAIFTSRKLVVPRLSNRKLFYFVCGFLALDVIFLIPYNILTPPYPLVYSAFLPNAQDLVTGTSEITLVMCSIHSPASTLDVILFLKGVTLVAGAGTAFLIRQVDRRFTSTSALGGAFYNCFLTIAIVVVILVEFKPEGNLESNMFIPVFAALWIIFVTLIALTLDSNVLLACQDFSQPLRRLLNGSKESKTKDRSTSVVKDGEKVEQDKRSTSSTIFVVNREMFPSQYDSFGNELLEKILEELNHQRTAVRRALASNTPGTAATTTTEVGADRRQSSTPRMPSKSKSTAALPALELGKSEPAYKISVDSPDITPKHSVVADV